MKKTLTLAAGVLYFAQSMAQPYQANKPVMCDSLENVTTTMKDKFGEEAVWFGDDLQDSSKYVMLANFQTKTWTFVQFTKEWACVLGAGTGAAPMKLGTSI
jgi:hypothetical protein